MTRINGFSYVELIAAIMILTITIVPATQYLTESMALRRRLERNGALIVLAIQTTEEQMAAINSGFTTSQTSGTFAAQGFPEFAYEYIRTDATSDGGVPDLLMAIIVRVWADDDGDVVLDSDESVVTLHTKMARSVE